MRGCRTDATPCIARHTSHTIEGTMKKPSRRFKCHLQTGLNTTHVLVSDILIGRWRACGQACQECQMFRQASNFLRQEASTRSVYERHFNCRTICAHKKPSLSRRQAAHKCPRHCQAASAPTSSPSPKPLRTGSASACCFWPALISEVSSKVGNGPYQDLYQDACENGCRPYRESRTVT